MKLIFDKSPTGIELKLQQDNQYFDITESIISLNIDVSHRGSIATLTIHPESILVGTDEIKLKVGDKTFKLLGFYE